MLLGASYTYIIECHDRRPDGSAILFQRRLLGGIASFFVTSCFVSLVRRDGDVLPLDLS